ncbi:hypothetical protein [Arthrobacter sp. TMN-50]
MGKKALLGVAVLAMMLTGCGGQAEAEQEAAAINAVTEPESAEPSRTPTPEPTTEEPTPTPEPTTEEPTPEPTTEAPEPAPPADGGTYGSVAALKDAAVAGGMDCPAWVERNHVTLAIGSGSCDDASVLAIYLNESDLSAQVDAWKQFGDLVEMEVLVGANWTVNAGGAGADAVALQEVMGGSLFRTSGP